MENASHIQQNEYYIVLKTSEVLQAPSFQASRITTETYIKTHLEVIESNEKVKVSVDKEKKIVFVKLSQVNGWLPVENQEGEQILEKINNNQENSIESGRFYYRVLLSIKLRTKPDISSPLVTDPQTNQTKVKHIDEIIEASTILTLPKSKVKYVKLACDEGWVFEQLPSGKLVLERLTVEPNITDGHFVYLVKIPVGVRVSPNIMSKRSGKGYKLNTIVEGIQRLNPPGSKITYVKLKNQEGWVFETTMDNKKVLELYEQKPFHRYLSESYYKLKDDTSVLEIPDINCENILKIRKKNTVVDISDEITPYKSEITYLKLRHDDGWICKNKCDGQLLVYEMKEDTQMISTPKFYKVLLDVYVRSGPDIECPRIPGIPVKTKGVIIESSLRIIPPGSSITYVKLAREHGWVFEQTYDDQNVLESLSIDPERKQEKFYFIIQHETPVRICPDSTSTIIRYLTSKEIIAVDTQLKLPDSTLTYLSLSNDKGWIADKNIDGEPNVSSTTEDIYRLYTSPPSWVALGFPTKQWFRVPVLEDKYILVNELLYQMEVFSSLNILVASSKGKENIPIERKGIYYLNDSKNIVTLQEIKHPANPLLLTGPWKQIWWIFEIEGKEHSIELQHGLRGGYRSIFFDGKQVESSRSVSAMVWDNGNRMIFDRLNHSFMVQITLQGNFFSMNSWFFSYELEIDGKKIHQQDVFSRS